MSNKKKKPIKKTPYDIRQNTAYFVKNRLPAFILAGMFIFWTIASIFGLIGYCRSKPKNTAIVTANAQTVGDYAQEQYLIDLYQFNGCIFMDQQDFFTFGTRFQVIIGHNEISYLVDGEDYSSGSDILFEDISIQTNNIGQFIGESFYFETDNGLFTFDYYDNITYDFILSSDYDSFEFYFYFNDTNGILAEQMVAFTMYFSFELPISSYFSSAIGSAPFDGYGYYSQPCGIVNIDALNYYYKFFLDNQNAYQNGYQAGYDLGSSQINQSSYNAGYDKGYALGAETYYDIGYNQGVNSAHEYTFDSLLSSVFDVPVRTFTSLFNFEILGINMASFFLSILTLCAVLAVVKMLI